MKINHLLFRQISRLWTVVVALALVTTAGAQTTNTTANTGTNAALAKTSFTEVTSQLDPGGDLYVYLSTAQWLEHLSGTVDEWRGKFTAMPEADTNDIADVNRIFDLVNHLCADSGIQSLDGVGLSSILVEPGMYRTKLLFHHAPGAGDGFLWKLGGKQPHPLTGLDLLPAKTSLAMFSDADAPLLWSVIQDEVARSGIPEAKDAIKSVPSEFEKDTKLDWNAFLKSLGGEMGVCVTLDDTNRVPIPLPSGMVTIPEPGILIVVRVNDETIFNRIADEFKTNDQVIVTETNGMRMRTMPLPIPVPFTLRPSVASSGGYLLMASSDTLIQEALAVKAGTVPGLKDTPEFKHLAQNIPVLGNQFGYMNKLFGQTVTDIQQQMIAANQTQDTDKAAWLKSLFQQRKAQYYYMVGANTPDGYLSIGNGNQSASALILLPAVAGSGMLAAMAIPNFTQARETSQENACINNLKMIDSAKNMWALEKNKDSTATPTEDDLKPYLPQNEMPKCPMGGIYTIGSMTEKPQCSVAGHVLPAN